MLSRRCLLVGFGCTVLVFISAACVAFPAGRATTSAVARPTAQVSTTAAAFENVVWARVPYCGCVDGVLTDNVSAALKRAQLAATVKLLNPTNGWMYFEVAFDPEAALPEQIAAAIKAGGGQVMAGPP